MASTSGKGELAKPKSQGADEPQPHVRVQALSKRFGGVRALVEVDLEITRGEIHGIVGENGAGKSTLGKVIAGVLQHDEGNLIVSGRAASYRSPRDALADGITIIAQEPALVPKRSVIENVFLGIEPHRLGVVSNKKLFERYAALTERVDISLPPQAKVGELRLADQQKVAVLRALARNAKLIVMDEPTSALTQDEVKKLLDIVRDLKARGTTILYISHFLKEVLSVADTVTVLKDGRLARSDPTTQATPEILVEAMLGRSIDQTFPKKVFPPQNAPIVVSVSGLCRKGFIEEVSFAIRAGEIIGLAGLIGSGRSDLARAIFAADHRDAGVIQVDGKSVEIKSPRQAIRAGIVLLPENRTAQGLLMRRPIVDNVTLPHLAEVSRLGVIAIRRERRETTDLVEEIDVRAENISARLDTLSGGNQQKVLFAKWLFRRPRLLIADEPTRGVDVGAKRALYGLIASLAAQGMAVLLISSELEEVMGLAHRVFAMREGRIVGKFDARSATEDEVLHAIFGTQKSSVITEA